MLDIKISLVITSSMLYSTVARHNIPYIVEYLALVISDAIRGPLKYIYPHFKAGFEKRRQKAEGSKSISPVTIY